jgi:hypothetical protein
MQVIGKYNGMVHLIKDTKGTWLDSNGILRKKNEYDLVGFWVPESEVSKYMEGQISLFEVI